MKYKSLCLDIEAINHLLQIGDLPPEWFESFVVPAPGGKFSLRVVDNNAYLVSTIANAESRLCVVDLTAGELATKLPIALRPDVWTRTLMGAISVIDRTIVLPRSWKKFHRRNLQSFQSAHFNSGYRGRTHIEGSPAGTPHVFVFNVGGLPDTDIDAVPRNIDVFNESIANWRGALSATPELPKKEDAELRERFEPPNHLLYDFTKGFTYSQWLARLSAAQRKFVELPMDRSIRLKGGAGTGKTLSLVVKLLREAYQNIANDKEFRYCVITHSDSTAKQIRQAIAAIDERGLLSDDRYSVKVRTLHQLAAEEQLIAQHGIEPIALDGQEGRRLQFELIQSEVSEFIKSDWPAFRLKAGSRMKEVLDKPQADTTMLTCELMNEFACVVSPLRAATPEELERLYMRENRAKWMMQLETSVDKRIVLQLYDRFQRQLIEMGAFSIDSLIVDFLNGLRSHIWNIRRLHNGFDAVFVDEMHLFNMTERSVFQFLMRRPSSVHVVMALDPKQSPWDSFLDGEHVVPSRRGMWSKMGLPDPQLVDLEKNFRSTKQITEVMTYIDDNWFPGLDFGEEWGRIGALNADRSGPVPIVCELDSSTALMDLVADRAKAAVRVLRSGRRVAVLFLSHEQFLTFSKAGRLADDGRFPFVLVSSRDDAGELSHCGNRFVMSMPEYVAGLQFDTVFLVEANKSEIAQFGTGIGAERRFVSTIYLGVGRAENRLEIFTSTERGGMAAPIKGCIDQKLVTQLDVDSLPRVR